MKRKKRREAREKKKQNFSNCRTSALGLSPPLCVARRPLPSHSLAHYACNNNGNRLGQTFFLNSRQVAASGALLPLLLLLLPACLPATWDSGPRRLHVCNLDTQLCPVTCFICCAAAHSCYLFHRRRFLLPMKPKNFNEEQPRSVSAYPYRCKSPLKFPPSSVCTCHLHFNGNAF